MYLKINNNEKDYFYKFDDDTKVTIGRGSSNSIQLSAEGVSRNHLEIHCKEGEYHIIDLATTNGSFINDEKLEPNVKIAFNTFFPVQLGFHAKLHLVDESSSTKTLDALVEQTKQDLAK